MHHNESSFTQANKINSDGAPSANPSKPNDFTTASEERIHGNFDTDADNEHYTDSTTESGASPPAREQLIAVAKKLYGDHLEFTTLSDPRIPEMLAKDFSKFRVTGPEEFLAVNCGARSNLAAIAFPFDIGWLNEFLTLNPILQGSLITVWGDLILLWTRIDGWRPANRALPRMVWLSNGLLPTIVEKAKNDGKPAKFQMRGDAIITVKFSDIKWRNDMNEVFVLDRFVNQYGPLFQQTDKRTTSLNYRTVGYYLAEVLGLFFDKNQNVFRICIPGETKVESLSKKKLESTISSWLGNVVARLGILPDGDHVHAIVRMLKDICEIKTLDEPDGLTEFLNECLERRAGSNITTKEMFAAYSEFCKSRAILSYPECVFLDVLTGFIRKKFALTKVHNVMRHNEKTGKLTARYGFNGLGIRKAAGAASESKEQTDVKDVQEVREVAEGEA